jgi:hypothetical protein
MKIIRYNELSSMALKSRCKLQINGIFSGCQPPISTSPSFALGFPCAETRGKEFLRVSATVQFSRHPVRFKYYIDEAVCQYNFAPKFTLIN